MSRRNQHWMNTPRFRRFLADVGTTNMASAIDSATTDMLEGRQHTCQPGSDGRNCILCGKSLLPTEPPAE